MMKQIFYNGTIVTMELPLYAEAVLINDGMIEQVGDFAALRIAAPEAELIDLAHKTMLPAFIDAHSHFSSYANAQLQVVLEETTSFEEIAERIHAFIQENQVPSGKWIVAKGYDHNMLLEQAHPTKELLDSIAPNNPLILQHQSGHCGVLNSAALVSLGITVSTPTPSGGVIGLADGELTGYMEESAYIQCIKNVPMYGIEEMLAAYSKAQEKYLSYGITTVQEGMMVTQMLPLYQSLLNSGLLCVDVVGYPDFSSMPEIRAALPNSLQKYNQHLKIGGYKIFLDGSPQVKTAWLKEPYQNSGDYVGYGTMSDAQVLAAVEQSAQEQMQLLAHCNGNAAIQQYIDAVQQVAARNPLITTLKLVIIHCQLIDAEQLDQVADLQMIPSFFIAHVLYWGDIHLQNLGEERAKFISPAHAGLDKGITFTFHQDAPVIEPNMLETIECAVNRKTKSGVVLGAEQRLNVLDALKAVTINAAYQYSEEDSKGSIHRGKQANFVILSDNPLTVSVEQIAEIAVLATIQNGQTVFRRKDE